MLVISTPRLLMLLGAFVWSSLNGSTFGDDPTGAPDSLTVRSIRMVQDRRDPHFGSIEFVLDPEMVEGLRIRGLSQAVFGNVFPVWVGRDTEKPRVLGTYVIEESFVRFVPRYHIESNLIHTARVNHSVLHDLLGLNGNPEPDIELTVLHRESKTPTTVVSAIYPTGDVPENLLRFYIHFSAPMSRGGVYKHIHLLDSEGERVDRAFLELEPELWDRESRRLTLLFDPGRIKRGLRPRSDLGSALEAGSRYTLLIGQGLEDAAGSNLVRTAKKHFKVGVADRVSPNPDQWTLRVPKSGSRDSLVLDLDEPVDHGLLLRMPEVVDPKGDLVPGEAFVSDGETRWMFVPDDVWKAARFDLRVDIRLEDRAGNRLDGLFDQVIEGQESGQKRSEPFVSVPFEIE